MADIFSYKYCQLVLYITLFQNATHILPKYIPNNHFSPRLTPPTLQNLTFARKLAYIRPDITCTERASDRISFTLCNSQLLLRFSSSFLVMDSKRYLFSLLNITLKNDGNVAAHKWRTVFGELLLLKFMEEIFKSL